MAFNVLVVDDSAVMRAMIVRTLRISGVPLGTVLEAADGAQALAAIAEHWIDLVLLDVNMPVMDGQECLTRLRADPATASLPVIVVSTEGSAARLDALRAHDVAFVHKPFAPETLRDTILRITGVSDVCVTDGAAAAGDDFDF